MWLLLFIRTPKKHANFTKRILKTSLVTLRCHKLIRSASHEKNVSRSVEVDIPVIQKLCARSNSFLFQTLTDGLTGRVLQTGTLMSDSERIIIFRLHPCSVGKFIFVNDCTGTSESRHNLMVRSVSKGSFNSHNEPTGQAAERENK